MKRLISLFLALFLCLTMTQPVFAAGQVLGIHILNTNELQDADTLLSPQIGQDDWRYVTIPLTLADTKNHEQWQSFFDQAKAKKIIPLVRLTTKFENGAWQVPTRKDIVQLIQFLSQLNWPTDQRHIIVFNEVNHAKEWGGTLDPASYAATLRFTSQWAKTEPDKQFIVLPAAMDLAAPNGHETKEAFDYLDQMSEADSEIFGQVDAWNSHSYANPGFSSAPQLTAQNSLRGFTHELSYLKTKTGRDYQVFITETGWIDNKTTRRWLETYYLYAMQHIWSDPRVVAVTPFVLRGDPGPFSGFSFLDRNGKPTAQYTAFQKALSRVTLGS